MYLFRVALMSEQGLGRGGSRAQCWIFGHNIKMETAHLNSMILKSAEHSV